MSESKHTPGEWGFEFKSDHTVIRSMEKCDRPGAGYVCHVNKNNVSEAEREANENLIAAAPTMREALEKIEMLTHVTGRGRVDQVLSMVREHARAALSKGADNER